MASSTTCPWPTTAPTWSSPARRSRPPRGTAARPAWRRWSGSAGPVAASSSSGRTTSRWLAAHGYRYVSFDGEMFVEFASLEEAVELTEIFYPSAVAEVRRRGCAAGSVRGAGGQPAARPRLQGDRAMKVAIVAPLVAAIREPQRGGSQAFVSDLARGLVGRGHEVHLYAASGSEVPGVQVIDTGVDHRALSATLYRASGAAARRAGRGRGGVRRRLRRGPRGPIRRRPQSRLRRARGQPRDRTARAGRAHAPPPAGRGGRRRASRCGAAATHRRRLPAYPQFQASAWRRVVPVDAILPPLRPDAVDRLVADGGGRRRLRRQAQPGEGSGRGDRDRACGRRPRSTSTATATTPTTRGSGSIRDAPSRASAVHPGVPRTSLWEAMARAAVVLCPARWEEPFGMVAAEAQACGTPGRRVPARRARRGDRRRA